jgi:hypothetical protein
MILSNRYENMLILLTLTNPMNTDDPVYYYHSESVAAMMFNIIELIGSGENGILNMEGILSHELVHCPIDLEDGKSFFEYMVEFHDTLQIMKKQGGGGEPQNFRFRDFIEWYNVNYPFTKWDEHREEIKEDSSALSISKKTNGV